MIRINLLPHREEKRKRRQQQFGVLAGISALIGPDGNTAVRSTQYATELMTGSVTPRAGLTPYARYRDVPLWILSAGLLIAGFILHFRKIS